MSERPPPARGRNLSGSSCESITSLGGTVRPLGLRASRHCCQRLGKYFVDPRRLVHKYFLVILICSFVPGPYFQDALLEAYKGEISAALDLSNTEFGMLFALSSVTGILCVPAYGLIAFLGQTRFALCSGFLCAISSFTVVFGFYSGSYFIMLAARITFWTALYGLMVVQTVIMYTLFQGRALQVAYGLAITACRLGAVGAYFFSGLLLHWFGNIHGPLCLTVMLVFVTFAATAMFAWLFHGTATAQLVRPLLGGGQAGKKFSLAQFQSVPRAVMLFSLAIGSLYGTVFPFEVIADDMLQVVYSYGSDSAGFLLTAAPAIALFSPCLGPCLGSTLRGKCTACIFGLLILSIALMVISIGQPFCAVPGFVLAGIGYSVGATALWTTLPAVVSANVPAEDRKDVEGLATGMCYAAIAFCQFISNWVVGAIKDVAPYRYVCLYLSGVSIFGACSVLAANTLRTSDVVDHSGDTTPELTRSASDSYLCVEPADDYMPVVWHESGNKIMIYSDYYDIAEENNMSTIEAWDLPSKVDFEKP